MPIDLADRKKDRGGRFNVAPSPHHSERALAVDPGKGSVVFESVFE